MYKSLLSRCCHLVMNIVKIEVYRIKRYVSFVSNQDQLAVSANTPPLLAGGAIRLNIKRPQQTGSAGSVSKSS